jgi:hypothetical protein
MAQATLRFIGLEGHTAAMAVADVAQEHGAAVPSRGPRGPRQGDLEHRSRTRPSQAQHLLFVSAAGPGGSGLCRS